MASSPPQYNVTGIDYAERDHFRHDGPIIDFHAHVMRTRPGDPPTGPPVGSGPGASLAQAEIMLDVGADFGVMQTLTMCPADDIAPLRERFGELLAFNAMINKKTADESDGEAYRNLERFLEQGIHCVKLWSAPRGRERGLFIDAPWRIEAVKRARSAGVRLVMVHVADPDAWFRTVYADAAKFGTKAEQYVGLEKMMQLFPDLVWIGAHMAGDAEHPDHLQALLEEYPQFYIDTSATKWQVREVSPRADAHRALLTKYPERFLFGTDLVTRHHLTREHYVSRYWCQRTLWESAWVGASPIADADYHGETPTPTLRGVNLPDEVTALVYYRNAKRLLNLPIV
ncbi:MAG: amidohydrolase family protein [Planctomycetes bacterium]|nr:amidohydrolase family protein [Planctomycetota bacterium]